MQFLDANSSAVPNCRYVTSAHCGSRTVSDRIFYKTLQLFFESFHLFVDFPPGITFISILRCLSSILFSISPSIHVTTRHRIGHLCSLTHFTFCGQIKSITVLSLTCRSKKKKNQTGAKEETEIFYFLFVAKKSFYTDLLFEN